MTRTFNFLHQRRRKFNPVKVNTISKNQDKVLPTSNYCELTREKNSSDVSNFSGGFVITLSVYLPK